MIQDLLDLGYSINEAKTYLAVLCLGRATAGKIAKEAQLERSSTYNALKKLSGQGLVSYIKETKVKIYSAPDPKKLIEIYEEKKEQAKQIIPKLTSIQSTAEQTETIEKFVGLQGVKTVLHDVLQSCDKNEEHLVLGLEGQLSTRLPTFAKIFVSRKDAKKMKSRALVRDKRQVHVKSKYSELRYVPQEVISPTNITIYKDKVAIIVWSQKPESIIIHNKDAAQAFKSYFEFMWKHAKTKKKG